jgi:hypothetical protein
MPPYSIFKSYNATNDAWEIHDIKDVGFDGSSWATTFKPLVEELVESSYELMLGWLGFDIIIPNIIIPSLKVIMSSMC